MRAAHAKDEVLAVQNVLATLTKLMQLAGDIFQLSIVATLEALPQGLQVEREFNRAADMFEYAITVHRGRDHAGETHARTSIAFTTSWTTRSRRPGPPAAVEEALTRLSRSLILAASPVERWVRRRAPAQCP